MKICSLCKLEKEDSEFYLRGDGKLRSECKGCCSLRSKKYNSTNQEVRKRAWKNYRCKSYGITSDDFDKMFNEQRGCCKICGIDITKKCHIDHNHTTGKVRGLLCHNCNVAIGHAKEDVNLLTKIIQYLETQG